MAEYIEREALLKVLKFRIKGQHRIYDTANMILSLVEDYVNATPTADVVEVRHGEWQNPEDPVCYQCSYCKKFSNQHYGTDEPIFFDYCPWCGAKMDGKGD